MKWTSEQQKVIEYRDRDILVSAAAGSGKTAVLVERIIRRITDPENPMDIDRLLVVTFTKAAAAEMRERIGNAIEEQCEKNPTDSHLRRQSALLHNAMITTIDSFCLFVVRNHFDEIHLDPNFRIADEGEIRLLEQDVLKQVFEECYGEQSESFTHLIDTYAGKRNDAAVRDMVGKIYRMSLSSPWPKEWVQGLGEPYRAEDTEGLFQTPMFQDIAENATLLLCDMRKRLSELLVTAQAEDGPTVYAKTLEEDIAALEQAKELEGYEAVKDFFAGLKFGNLSPVRKYTGDILKKEAVQNERNAIKKEIEEMRKKYFSGDGDAILEQLKRLRPLVEELVRVTLLYMDAMERAKRKKRIVDFSDIEHFALKILVDEETKCSKQTAQEFRAHFEEIMIDEYQDSNQVQEEIMLAISKEHNMFMVGVVKQSIYRFRLARPELFMQKYDSFSTEDGLQQRIDLHRNFRSRREVVDFCNDIFYKIMSPDLGKVRYDEEAALYCGASYPENTGMDAELLLVDEEDPLLADKKDWNKHELEAHLVAVRIQELMKQTMVTQKDGTTRPLRYSDIVILFRSLKNWGTDFVKVLEEHGIPAYVESSTGYFSATEVQTVLNMLKILDNPYQDIPMAAVLKSPIVGLDEEELAEIRVKDETVTFAEAAMQEMREAGEGPLFEFYRTYCALREKQDLPIHELIQELLEQTGYGNYVAALPAGEQRAANLAMLVEKAVDYEKTSYRGLFHFVRYIDALQKYEIDFGEADVSGENADVVRIMTIHKSKGLEFPVVFVSGLSKKFNQMDAGDKLVVHADLGLGLTEVTGSPKVKKNCIYREEIADRIRRENQGEELRILYVALTRAKEKLILSGVIKNLEKTVSGYTGNRTEHMPISYRQRVKAGSYMDWVLPAMLSYPEKYTIDTVDVAEIVTAQVEEKADRKISHGQLLEQIEAADDSQVSRYDELFSYQYPYQREIGRKSKYSVSELKHVSLVQQYDRTEGGEEVPDYAKSDKDSYIPAFARGAEQTDHALGANRGTAVHRVMECLDFQALAQVDRSSRTEVKQFVKSELNRMLSAGELTKEWYELIYPPVIETFAQTQTAERMAQAALRGELYREKPFVMQQDGVLVQGIIDVFWREEDTIQLLDYKTDRVEQAEELRKRYQMQLDLYGNALESIFSGNAEKYIYSFRLHAVVTL